MACMHVCMVMSEVQNSPPPREVPLVQLIEHYQAVGATVFADNAVRALIEVQQQGVVHLGDCTRRLVQ